MILFVVLWKSHFARPSQHKPWRDMDPSYRFECCINADSTDCAIAAKPYKSARVKVEKTSAVIHSCSWHNFVESGSTINTTLFDVFYKIWVDFLHICCENTFTAFTLHLHSVTLSIWSFLTRFIHSNIVAILILQTSTGQNENMHYFIICPVDCSPHSLFFTFCNCAIKLLHTYNSKSQF